MTGKASVSVRVVFCCSLFLLTVLSDPVNGKYRQSDIQTQTWAEFPVNFTPWTGSSLLLSKMLWNSSTAFPPSRVVRPGQGRLYSDQMIGTIGSTPGVVRATYGPFVVEGSLPRQPGNDSLGYLIQTEVATRNISPHWSKIQVLFLLKAKDKAAGLVPCIRTRARNGNAQAVAACTPSGVSLACLAQVTIPSSWWLDTSVNTISLGYSVHQRGERGSCLLPVGQQDDGDVLRSEQSLGEVQLRQRRETLNTVKEDDVVWLHVPKSDVAINERFQIAVSVHPNFTGSGCVIRAKARRGLRVVDVHPADPLIWDISYKVKQDGASAMVTASRLETDKTPATDQSVDVSAFNVEFEVENTTTSSRLVNWRIDYELGKPHTTAIVTTIAVASRAGQAIIPISWADNVVNTAVLNGMRVSVPLSVLTVTQSGQVYNITASAHCTSLDPDVLKVTEDCTFVFVDGTESGGALNKKIRISFAEKDVYKAFDVWYPELPLEVAVSDPKLSLIRSWKIPVVENRSKRDAQQAMSIGAETLNLLGQDDSASKGVGRDHSTKGKCQLRYQQAKVDAYTRFYALQANTVPRLPGRKQYMYGGDIRHCVTRTVKNQLQALDPTVVNVKGTNVIGRSEGTTQVMVVGPNTKDIIGESTITVTSDKVKVIELHVGLVSGLTMESVPLASYDGGRDQSVTRVTSRSTLFAQYQEAIMDARLEFDDGTEVSLEDIDPRDFVADITTLNSEIVNESPGSTPHHPAIIAVQEGVTTLMLEIAIPLECQRRKKNSAIALYFNPVNVSFDRPMPAGMGGGEAVAGRDWDRTRLTPGIGLTDYGVIRDDYNPDERPNHGGRGSGGGGSKPDKGILLIPIDGNIFPKEPVVDYNPYLEGSLNEFDAQDSDGADDDANKQLTYTGDPALLTPLEIGMYVVLGIFCLAILAFMINCFMFMARYRHSKKLPVNCVGGGSNGAYPQNWVLFGSEFDGRTMPQPVNEEVIPMRDFRDDSNRDSASRGEHTCTESEVSIERHSMEEEERPAGNEVTECFCEDPECSCTSCDELESPGPCVVITGHTQVATFVPCQCQCQCPNGEAAPSELDDISITECTDTERMPLNVQLSSGTGQTTAKTCCCAQAQSTACHEVASDTEPVGTDLRMTVNPTDEMGLVRTGSTNSISISDAEQSHSNEVESVC